MRPSTTSRSFTRTPTTPNRIKEVFEWTTTQEYKELNFNREALTVNPAKACQPLGAVLCALGFEKTLPYVHGSQGCVAYFRTYFNRHFKEPISCVSDSMTEDAAVFGGQKNMFAGLENAKALYKPEMIAVSTTCMAEVIGDDLNAFINNAKKNGHVPQDFPTPFAHTPSFVGSHVTGWDNMFEGILRYFTLNEMDDKKPGSNGKINVVPGFETYLGNFRVIKRMLTEMGVDHTFLSDPEEILDTPADGQFRMYAGGTTQAQVKDAPNAINTLLLQPWQLEKTAKYVEGTWGHTIPELTIPMGLEWTDQFLMNVSEADRQADPGVAREGARPPGRHDDRLAHLAARQDVRALGRPRLRHGPDQDPAGAGGGADPRPVPQRQQALAQGDAEGRSRPRPTARKPRSTSAATSGTCGRWSSPRSPTS